MPQSVRIIDPPSISPLRKPPGTKQSQIYSNTYIQIVPAEPTHKVYFSTDGDEPDPWHRIRNGQERTFKYKGPFRLREGPRIVRAMSVSRKDRASSRITTKAFQVITNPDYTINEDTETESSTLVSVSSLTTDTSEPELEHSSHLLTASQTPRLAESMEISQPQLEDMEFTDSTSLVSSESDLVSFKSVNKYGQELKRLDNSLNIDRYEDIRNILDANYINEMCHRRQNGELKGTPYGTRLCPREDLDSYFDSSSHHGTMKDSFDSDGETEISNYFRQSQRMSPDRVRWHSPDRSNFTAAPQEPPAFWSTQTPRVRFSDDPVPRSSSPGNSRLAYDDQQLIDGLLPDPVNLRFSQNNGIMRRTDNDLSDYYDKRMLQSERHINHPDSHHSVYLYSEGRALPNQRKVTRNQSPISDGRRSPLADVAYKAGYKFGTGYLSDPESRSRTNKQRSSSSSSSSSSNSDSEPTDIKDIFGKVKCDKEKCEKKISKKKKKEEKKDKQKDADLINDEKKYDKKKKEKENKEKSKVLDTENKIDDLLSDANLRECKRDKADNQTTDQGIPSTRVLKTKKGGLNFINDSGTQINFWGAPPEEVVKKVKELIPTAKIQSDGKTVQDKQLGPSPVPALPFSPSQTYPVPLTDTTEPLGAEETPLVPALQTQHQQEQHSIGGFFRKLFKLDDKKKDKKKGAPETIRESDDSVFEKLHKECLKKKRLWEDPDFKATDSSVYYNECPVDGDIEWKRPSEICDDPQMFVGGASRFDVKQGVLGNCWLLAAVASLTTNKKLLHRVVPHKQNFTDEYAGIFCFNFWQYGKWIEVVIDDRLPTTNGKLIFMHSEEGNEFWSPLLEKAYAKLCGCYENLSGGLASEAMTDFTGGVTEQFNFTEELPDNMFQIMLKAYERQSLMGCSIDASPDEMEAELDNGLIKGHAYSITAVKVLDTDDGEVQLVRVRNPWGNECEWKGAWSDQSEEWQTVSDDVKESVDIQFDHDGEFWMSFRDFSTHFQRMEICHLNPDSLGSDDDSTKWLCKTFTGAWKKNVNAGGCRNFPKSYHTNPQYRIQITDADDDDEEEIGTIIVGLMQKGRRKLRAEGGGNLTMGYEIFNTDGISSKKALDREFFKKHKPVTTSAYINMREICSRHRLTPGDYCIVLTTYEPNEEAEYLLRVFSEKPSDVSEADESTSIVQLQNVAVAHSSPGQALEAEKQFKKYGGEDEEVEASELQNILNHVFMKDFKFSGFDINLCRSMIAMSDDDCTGKLTLKEFKVLWSELQKCKNVFREYDTDKSCNLNSFELREALRHCGYTVSNTTFQSIVLRFSDKDGNVHFDDFVACVIKLRTLYRIFASQTEKDMATFSLDGFIKYTVYS